MPLKFTGLPGIVDDISASGVQHWKRKRQNGDRPGE
jgi:hypothetical protein